MWRLVCPAIAARRGRNGVDADYQQYEAAGHHCHIGFAGGIEWHVAEYGCCHSERKSAGSSA